MAWMEWMHVAAELGARQERIMGRESSAWDQITMWYYIMLSLVDARCLLDAHTTLRRATRRCGPEALGSLGRPGAAADSARRVGTAARSQSALVCMDSVGSPSWRYQKPNATVPKTPTRNFSITPHSPDPLVRRETCRRINQICNTISDYNCAALTRINRSTRLPRPARSGPFHGLRAGTAPSAALRAPWR